MRERYVEQVRLLMRLLPVIAREEVFALKGGSAINLFYRDLPRLSVDIDLTYLPIEDRETSLANIDQALDRIIAAASLENRDVRFQRIAGGGNLETRIMATRGTTNVKIETSPVMRGTVLPPVLSKVSDAVEETFGFAEMHVLSFEDLYAGKLHAALDRQHPRDLFDVKLLYENEGLTKDLLRVFLVYVSTSGRPPHELLAPALVPIEELHDQEFAGMTRDEVDPVDLENVRSRLIADIRNALTGEFAQFLLSLHDGEPDFNLIGLPAAELLPAVQWKLLNLRRLKNENPVKHEELRGRLEELLS